MLTAWHRSSTSQSRSGSPTYTSARDTSTLATMPTERSAASVTDAYESMAETSSGRSGPPTPARSVASSSRSGPFGQRRQAPVEVQGEVVQVRRVLVLLEREHEVLERQQHARVDLEGEVQVERSAAGLLGVDVDLPGLAKRVGLDEVPLVVHVEAVGDGVVLEVGHEAGDVDDGHSCSSGREVGGLSLPRSIRVTHPATVPDGDRRGAARRAPRRGGGGRRRPRRPSPTGARRAASPVSTTATWPPMRPRWRSCSSAASGVLSEESGRHARGPDGDRRRRSARRLDQRGPTDVVVGDEPVRRRW